MRVWEAGSGGPLLAIHGLGGSGRYWRRLPDRLGEGVRIVAPDLGGFGASDKPRAEQYDLPFHLGNLDAALEGAASGVVVVGHSVGGVLAVIWAAENADRVSGLALLATPFPAAEGDYAWMRDGIPPPGSRAVMRGFRILVPALSVPVGVARRYPPGVALDYARQGFLGRTRTTWWALHDPGVARRLGSAAEALGGVPTLLATAADDRTVGLDAQERWAGLLPAAERIVVPRGGHQFLLRNVEPLASWLGRVPRA
jgi:pimeloyl-ACP methyl ester carboxylesterase